MKTRTLNSACCKLSSTMSLASGSCKQLHFFPTIIVSFKTLPSLATFVQIMPNQKHWSYCYIFELKKNVLRYFVWCAMSLFGHATHITKHQIDKKSSIALNDNLTCLPTLNYRKHLNRLIGKKLHLCRPFYKAGCPKSIPMHFLLLGTLATFYFDQSMNILQTTGHLLKSRQTSPWMVR